MRSLQASTWAHLSMAIALLLSMSACSRQTVMPLVCSINQQIDVYPNDNYSSHWTLLVQDPHTLEEVGKAHLMAGWSSTAIDQYAVTLTQDMRTFSIPRNNQDSQIQIEFRETNSELDADSLRPSRTSHYGNYDKDTGRWTTINYSCYLHINHQNQEGLLRMWVTLDTAGEASLRVGERQFGDFNIQVRSNPDQAHASMGN